MMSEAVEEHILYDALESIKAKQLVPEEIHRILWNVFRTRFGNALEAVEGDKVKKIVFKLSNRIVWCVSGKERNYLILPDAGYCSCEDFYFRVISHEEFICYHLLAQKLAQALGRYIIVEEKDERYEEVVLKMAREGEQARKLPIAKVENIRRIVAGVLSEEKCLPLGKLLEAVREAGFPELTRKHLVSILVADKTKRFRSFEGLWDIINVY
jgi:predicted nucleic acid-binding Zn finger protein